MKLFIDTHSEKATVALITSTQVVYKEKTSDRSHSEIVVPLIDEMLKSEQVELSELDEIIVVNGPGSFTGVRIGVTIAKTIAFSFKKPIKTITSLEMYGVSSTENFDLVTIEDSKGVYSARKIGDEYVDYQYQRRKEFEAYVEKNSFAVLVKKELNFKRILEYLEDKEAINPHKVNPIYIKEIDALK